MQEPHTDAQPPGPCTKRSGATHAAILNWAGQAVQPCSDATHTPAFKQPCSTDASMQPGNTRAFNPDGAELHASFRVQEP
jgi:hypothetical protein